MIESTTRYLMGDLDAKAGFELVAEETRFGNGNLFQQTAPSGKAIRFVYDPLNRPVLKDYPPFYAPSGPADPNDVIWAYDDTNSNGVGRLRSVQIPALGYSRFLGYDLRGRVTSKTVMILGTSFPFAYYYDGLDRRTAVYFPDLEWVSVEYRGTAQTSVTYYDGATPTTWVNDIQYHESGDISSISFPQGSVTQTYQYDPSSFRMSSTTTTVGGTQQQRLTLGWDRAGNLLSSADAMNCQSQQFTYDSLHRLASATATGQGSCAYAQYPATAYQYDAGDNLRWKGSRELRYGEITNAGVPSVLQVWETGSQVGSFPNYDADGNVLSRSKGGVSQTFLYNADGRLATRTTPAPTLFLRYDEEGNRFYKRLAGGKTIYMVDDEYEVDLTASRHDKHIFVGGRRVLTVGKDGLGTPQSPGTAGSRRLHYLHSNQVRSNDLVTNDLGQVEQRTYFEPYGEILAVVDQYGAAIAPANRATNYLYTDQLNDSETSLHYFGARYYDAWVGRFTGPDPVLRTATELALSGHTYAYANGNPIRFSDPAGLWPDEPQLDPGDTWRPSPYSGDLFIRSFAPFDRFGGGFEGDNRGFTTDLLVTSRISAQVPIDLSTLEVLGDPRVQSSRSSCLGDFCRALVSAATGQPIREQTVGIGQPTISFSSLSRRGLVIDVAGANPLLPSPDIDLRLSLQRSNAGLWLGLTGDAFPNAEVFFIDQAGHARMLLEFSTPGSAVLGPYMYLPFDAQRDMGTAFIEGF